MLCKPSCIILVLISVSCHNQAGRQMPRGTIKNQAASIDNPYATIEKIPLPEGFHRLPLNSNSFGTWLRNRPLKKDKTVYLYNGEEKTNQAAQFAVLDISVGDKDLQQCADAVMRLRAEYFYEKKEFDSLVFYDNERGVYKFTPPYTRANFDNYLTRVFGMCGSASLAKQLHPVALLSDIQPGDVIIRGGFPGHAVIVMDVALNDAGEKLFMIAQSFMPAQNIHVLINENNEVYSPWYQATGKQIITPEYLFQANELKRW